MCACFDYDPDHWKLIHVKVISIAIIIPSAKKYQFHSKQTGCGRVLPTQMSRKNYMQEEPKIYFIISNKNKAIKDYFKHEGKKDTY